MKTLLLVFPLIQMTLMAAPSCCSTNLPAGAPLTERSIYQVESLWTSDYGKPVRLAQLQGRVQVVTMFFASCISACPVLVHDMKQIEAGLLEAGITNVGYVLVTFDTERDTAEKLHSFRKQRSLGDEWQLLRGQSEDVLELAALLGVKFKLESSGQYAHSNIISVLNEEGEIVHQQVGLNIDPSATIAVVQKSAVGKTAGRD